MTKLLLTLTTLSLIVIAAGVSVLVARLTFASVPDSAGVIHACYSNLSSPQGDLRMIHTASKFPVGSATCKPGETPISWNATGPAGAPGTNGTNGTNGATNVVMRSASSGVSGTFGSTDASCQGVERVIGGGYDVETGGTGAVVSVFESQPVAASATSDIPVSWRAGAQNIGNTITGNINVIVYVVCASP